MYDRERERVCRKIEKQREMKEGSLQKVYRKIKMREIKGKSDCILCKDNEIYYLKRLKWLLDF